MIVKIVYSDDWMRLYSNVINIDKDIVEGKAMISFLQDVKGVSDPISYTISGNNIELVFLMNDEGKIIEIFE